MWGTHAPLGQRREWDMQGVVGRCTRNVPTCSAAAASCLHHPEVPLPTRSLGCLHAVHLHRGCTARCLTCRCPPRRQPPCAPLPPLGREEKECRFCGSVLPLWVHNIAPSAVKPAPEALINVHGPDGSQHRIPLRPGLAGRREFTRRVRQVLCLPDYMAVTFNFEVAVPGLGG